MIEHKEGCNCYSCVCKRLEALRHKDDSELQEHEKRIKQRLQEHEFYKSVFKNK